MDRPRLLPEDEGPVAAVAIVRIRTGKPDLAGLGHQEIAVMTGRGLPAADGAIDRVRAGREVFSRIADDAVFTHAAGEIAMAEPACRRHGAGLVLCRLVEGGI